MELEFAVVVSTIASLLLVFIYGYLYSMEKKYVFTIWMIGWTLYSFRFVFILLDMYHENYVFIAFSQFLSVVSVVCIMLGMYISLNRRINIIWTILTVFVLAWVGIGSILGISPMLLDIPIFGFSSLIFIFLGIMFFKDRQIYLVNYYLGIIFVLWGLHKIDYPFYKDSFWFAPAGYLLGAFFSVAAAFGILMLYFEKNRTLYIESENKFKNLVNNTQMHVYSCSTDGTIISVNKKMYEDFKSDPSSLLGTKIWELFNERKKEDSINFFNSTVNESKNVKFSTDTIISGVKKYFEVSMAPQIDNNKVIAVTCSNHDITDIKEGKKIIEQYAYYDNLTKLPNKVFLINKLKETSINCSKQNTKFAVILLDIDEFKKVNDSMGHYYGDQVLKMFADRINELTSNTIYAARYSSDEFVIVLENVENEDILYFLKGLEVVFDYSYLVNGHSINISVSMGVAVFPENGGNPADIIAKADTAMYKAKKMGMNNYQFFDSKIQEELHRKLNVQNNLKHCVKNKELMLYFQPQINIENGTIRGFEVLLRWKNNELGFVMPDEFIPVAEETGLIVPIGTWVLVNACVKNKELVDKYGKEFIVSVNISYKQFKQKNFVLSVRKILEETGLNPKLLELEVTESIMIDSLDVIIKQLDELRNIGVKISLDDFGTGYSSLNYLKNLPCDTLKIDKSFISDSNDINEEYHGNSFVKTIVLLGHNLGLKVVAEGVEKNKQLMCLHNYECDYYQGYFASKPLPEEKFIEYLNNSFEP